jgi:hypothetical protein
MRGFIERELQRFEEWKKTETSLRTQVFEFCSNCDEALWTDEGELEDQIKQAFSAPAAVERRRKPWPPLREGCPEGTGGVS